MKNNHLWLIGIVAVALINMAACKKDARLDTSIPGTIQPDSSKVYIPVSINGSDVTTIFTYEANNSDILNSITRQYNDSDPSDTSYTILYNTLNQPLNISCFVNGVGITLTEYILDANGKVIRGNVYYVTTESHGVWGDMYVPTTLKSYYTLTYNNSNQLTQVSYFHADGQKNYDEFFEYTSEGNISGILSSGKINLEYDNFNGIGKSVKNAHLFYVEGRNSLLFYNRNNPVKLNEISCTYKYNVDKFPVEIAIISPDTTLVYAIEYDVK